VAIKFGWRFITSQQGRICMTTVTTSLILRVGCCRRKLLRHFDDFDLISQKIILNYSRDKKFILENEL
jgi:hypothetical protein